MTENVLLVYDLEAQVLHDETGIPLSQARDRVILNWLADGDTRPYFDWVLAGHVPSRDVMVYLAAMMAKADSPDCLPPEAQQLTKYGLGITGRKRGDRSNLEIDRRDFFIGREVAKRIASGEKYEAAIEAVHAWLPSVGLHVGRQTVRDAYDKRRPHTEG